MKKILFFMLLTAISVFSFAQQGNMKMDTMHHNKMMHAKKMDHSMKDCVMMEDGKMMMMKDGKMMDMDQDMTMKNGSMVMTDGTVKMKSGKTMKLNNGQCVYMDGKVGSMKMHAGAKMKKDKM